MRNLFLLASAAVFATVGVATSPSAFGADAPDNAESALPSQALFDGVASRWMSRGFTTRTVRANGVDLHIAEAGHGDLIILLHGYPQSGEIWRFVAPELANNHHVVIPDLRGMGLSEAAPDGYDLSTVAEDIHQVTLSMGYSRVKVVGHDWGASVGTVYALRYRDEVTKLGFLESALPGGGFEDLWTFAKPNPGFTFIPFLLMGGSDASDDTTVGLIKGREEVFLRHLWSDFTGDKQAAPFENWKPYIEAMQRPGVARAGASYYRSTYRSADEVRALDVSKLDIPVMSIAGEKGIGARQQAFVAAFAVSVSANTIIPGAGHFIAEERPVEVTAALRKFLND
jgi:pimeloyl-ACP methyl ester carboxylesterase